MNNAQKLKELADVVVLASEDLSKGRVQIAHALLQKGLDAVGKIEGLNAKPIPQQVFDGVGVHMDENGAVGLVFLRAGQPAFYDEVRHLVPGDHLTRTAGVNLIVQFVEGN